MKYSLMTFANVRSFSLFYLHTPRAAVLTFAFVPSTTTLKRKLPSRFDIIGTLSPPAPFPRRICFVLVTRAHDNNVRFEAKHPLRNDYNTYCVAIYFLSFHYSQTRSLAIIVINTHVHAVFYITQDHFFYFFSISRVLSLN